MEKVDELIKKFGLPEDLAREVCRTFAAAELLEVDINPTSEPKRNKAAIEQVIKAEYGLTKPAENVYTIDPKITNITFTIKGVKVDIDDIAVIEQIRQLIADAEFEYTPKYRKITARKYLRDIAQKLIDYSDAESKNAKMRFAADVFTEFDEYFKTGDKRERAKKIKNLFNN